MPIVRVNQSGVGAGDLIIRRPRALKLTRFQINKQSIKASMMNISVESLSLIEDIVSEVIILRNYFYFLWQSVKIKSYC